LGDYQQARALDEDTLTRFRRVLGADHPNTLGSASDLAADLAALGDYHQARSLHEDTLTAPDGSWARTTPLRLSADNLAAVMRQLGDTERQ
jgi:Tetratricopeptide repeat